MVKITNKLGNSTKHRSNLIIDDETSVSYLEEIS